jgi:hypothetical protein
VSSCLRGGTPSVSPGTGGIAAPSAATTGPRRHRREHLLAGWILIPAPTATTMQLLCSKEPAIAGLPRHRSCYTVVPRVFPLSGMTRVPVCALSEGIPLRVRVRVGLVDAGVPVPCPSHQWPGLAWLKSARLGLAHGFEPGWAHHYFTNVVTISLPYFNHSTPQKQSYGVHLTGYELLWRQYNIIMLHMAKSGFPQFHNKVTIFLSYFNHFTLQKQCYIQLTIQW